MQSENSLWNLGRRDETVAILLAGGNEFEQLANSDVSQATQNDFGDRWRPVCLFIAASAYARACWRLEVLAKDQAVDPGNRLDEARHKSLKALRAAIAGGFDSQAVQILGADDIATLLREDDWTVLGKDPEVAKIFAASSPSP